MSKIIKSNGKLKIYVSKDICEHVKLAVSDLKDDFNRVVKNIEFIDTNDYLDADIIVSNKGLADFDFVNKIKANFTHDEEFCYSIKNNKIYLLGNDDFGVMWAIYTFSEKELGIPPFYFFNNFKFTKKKSLEIKGKTLSDYPKTKFRGWFINDEDLLSEFRIGGKRDVNYIFYKTIQDDFIINKIAETALRYRMNLIIPASLVDIMNKDEERLIELSSRRGLYVSQHHIEPLGVSGQGYRKFAKNRGYDENLSYISRKEQAIECWNLYAEKWAKYPRIIWQIGLRGNGDKPVWATDSNVGNSDKERGELISSALKTQYNIIKSHVKGEFYTTSTLWMEGAELLSKGVLDIPKDTIIVFADIGMNQMFAEDFFTVKREKDRNYGVYYHSNYWHTGPHLSECVLPKRIDFSYNLIKEYNSDYYAILNVSNVKEFTFSIKLNADKQWYGSDRSILDIEKEYCNFFGKENAKQILKGIDTYFNGLGAIPDQRYYDFCNKYNFKYYNYKNLDFPVCNINDGIAFWLGRFLPFKLKLDWYSEEFTETIKNSLKEMKKANKIFANIIGKLGTEKKNAFASQWYYQSFYWVKLLTMLNEHNLAVVDYKNGKKNKVIPRFNKSIEGLNEVKKLRSKLFTGFWKDWFKGDKKLGLKLLIWVQNEEIRNYKKMIKK